MATVTYEDVLKARATLIEQHEELYANIDRRKIPYSILGFARMLAAYCEVYYQYNTGRPLDTMPVPLRLMLDGFAMHTITEIMQTLVLTNSLYKMSFSLCKERGTEPPCEQYVAVAQAYGIPRARTAIIPIPITTILESLQLLFVAGKCG
jgi:hypothetical protein